MKGNGVHIWNINRLSLDKKIMDMHACQSKKQKELWQLTGH